MTLIVEIRINYQTQTVTFIWRDGEVEEYIHPTNARMPPDPGPEPAPPIEPPDATPEQLTVHEGAIRAFEADHAQWAAVTQERAAADKAQEFRDWEADTAQPMADKVAQWMKKKRPDLKVNR